MLKTIIIDDEQHCINRLKELLISYESDVRLIGSYQLYNEAFDAIRMHKPDFIFLDVQLGDRTGFELLKALRPINFEVIFVTAFDRYAVEAFQFSATDYLLKPVDEEGLQGAIKKLREKSSMKDLSVKFEALFHNLEQGQNTFKKIAIPVAEGLTFISINDIIRCQSDVNYTHIFMNDGQQLTVTKTLKQFEELLSDYNFFRVHNSHMINLAYIKKYTKGRGGIVEMTDGSEIEVSVRRKDLFLKCLSQKRILLP